MAGRTSYYGGIVLDGLIFHIDAAKQESYAKRGLRYMQAGNSNAFLDFADTSKSPSSANATGAIINGATFSNFSPYHLSDSTKPQYWHNPALSAWRDSAGIGTFYGNIEFDGVNDYVGFGSTPEMNGIKDITVSAWFYVNKFKSGAVPTGGTSSIIASRYNGVNGWALAYNNQGVVYFDGRESGAEYLSVTASITLKSSNSTANGGWYNAVGTKQGNVWSIYVAETNRYVVDGDRSVYVGPGQQSLLGTRTMGVGTTAFTTNNLYLGCVFDTPTLHMDGRLMSLSVYNRALSLSEINQNYDSFAKRIISSTVPSGGPEFITKWDTSIYNDWTAKTIEIPINNSYTYNYTVDWGDGITTTGHTGNATHTYATDGIYTVKITGTFPAIRSGNAYSVRMTEVSQWGTTQWLTMNQGFYGCSNMNVTATDVPDLSLATDISFIFTDCLMLDANLSGWDVSTITDMSFAFYMGSNESGAIFNNGSSPMTWNTSAVQYMMGMFWNLTSFNADITSWNTANVLNMSNMFNSATSFNQPISRNGSAWNTLKVTEMTSMFSQALDFNQNIGNWNTGAVTNMSNMFGGASAFNNGSAANTTGPAMLWDTSKVIDMSGMFANADVFNADISSWNTILVNNMYYMFQYAYKFNINIGGWNTSAVTFMAQLFYGATSFNQYIGLWNTAAVTNMVGMFYGATSFNNGGQSMTTSGNSWNTSNVTDMSDMFSYCAFNQNIGNWNTIKVTSMNGMFTNNINFNQNIGSWNTAAVTGMTSMFNGASAFNLPLVRSGSSWNTSNVINMAYMFSNATAFDQNIGNWQVGNVLDLTNFMATKTPTTFSTTNLNAIYNGWSTQTLKPNLIISFGTAKYTSAATAGRNILTSSPKLWQITDGGI